MHLGTNKSQIKGLILFCFVAMFLIMVKATDALQEPEPDKLLITEFYYDTPGQDDAEEWVELANIGSTVIDLRRYKVGDEEKTGGGEGMLRFPKDATLAPGQTIVVAQTATGFRRLFGSTPDFEIISSDTAVPDMSSYALWATGSFALANGGDELLLINGKNKIVDAVSYGDSTAVFDPAIGSVFRGQSIERVPANCDGDSAAGWQPQRFPTPGEITLTGDCAPGTHLVTLEEPDVTVPTKAAPQPSDETVPTATAVDQTKPIGEIQGRGDISPYVNQEVTLQGVVTGVYEDRNTAGTTFYTMFVQDEAGTTDGDPLTSDAIAVFFGRQRPLQAIGERVTITGQVTEFFGLTEIDDRNLIIESSAANILLPEAVIIDPPADNAAQARYFEAFEGMVVKMPGTAYVVGPTYAGCGFAVVTGDEPKRLLRRRLADPVGEIVTVLHSSDVDCGQFPNVKVGDRVSGISGPLTYNFDQFKIVQQTTDALAVTAVPLPTPLSPPLAAVGQFSIASLNVENHFDVIDDTGDDAEPKPTVDELLRKQDKLAFAISKTLGCPTLIGVQEVEKAGLLTALAEATAVACGFTYDVTHFDSADVRGIDVALLSDPSRVQVVTFALRQGCTPIDTGIRDRSISCPENQAPLFSRPPLQADLLLDGLPLTVMVNHFKSKRGGERETAPRRLAQAQHINRSVDDLLLADAEARIIVLGDFNDYDQASALLEMTENGSLTNVMLQMPAQERYSFVFGGASQLIDAVMVSPQLVEEVTAVTIQHTNADYPESLGEDTSALGMPYKATDHDLPLVIFDLPGLQPQPTITPLPEGNESNDGNMWLLALLIGLGLLGVGGGLFWYRRSNTR